MYHISVSYQGGIQAYAVLSNFFISAVPSFSQRYPAQAFRVVCTESLHSTSSVTPVSRWCCVVWLCLSIASLEFVLPHAQQAPHVAESCFRSAKHRYTHSYRPFSIPVEGVSHVLWSVRRELSSQARHTSTGASRRNRTHLQYTLTQGCNSRCPKIPQKDLHLPELANAGPGLPCDSLVPVRYRRQPHSPPPLLPTSLPPLPGPPASRDQSSSD